MKSYSLFCSKATLSSKFKQRISMLKEYSKLNLAMISSTLRKGIPVSAIIFLITGCVEPVDDWETHLTYDNYWLEYSECRKIETVGHCNDTVKKNDYWSNVGVYDRYLELNTNDESIAVWMECHDQAFGPDLDTPFRWRDGRDNSDGSIKPYTSLWIKEKYDQKECDRISTAEEFETELKKLKKIVKSQ